MIQISGTAAPGPRETGSSEGVLYDRSRAPLS